MNERPKILLVGCGNMGSALIRGWLQHGWSKSDIEVIDDGENGKLVADSLGVKVTRKLSAEPQANIIVFAVKPQSLAQILPDYKKFVNSDRVFLSIAAGKPIEFYETFLGKEAAIVRGMPNTPVAIRQGVTVLVSNRKVKPSQRAASEVLMEAVGRVTWLDNEKLMNAVTAISGSGPAYVFLIIEALSKAGIEVGLHKDLAEELALMTVVGAGALAISSDTSPAELRRRVTSPGGTTEAALDVLMDNENLSTLLKEAVLAATERGKDLA